MIKEELSRHWGANPTGYCYCGCGERTKSYFHAGGDSQYAAKLLGELRGNGAVAAAIQKLVQYG